MPAVSEPPVKTTNSAAQVEEKAAPRRFFFRKQNRILKRADFLRTYDKGRVYRRSLVHVFILAGSTADGTVASEMGPTRLGITATRKTGNAVKRNRARRLVRESFRHTLPDLKPGYEIVVNVTRAATAAPYEKLHGQLMEIWKQTGLLIND